MSIEAEIARHIYSRIRNKAIERKSVEVPVRIEEYKRLWPSASRDQIIRAHLIAYEMSVNDVAECIATASRETPTAAPDALGEIGNKSPR